MNRLRRCCWIAAGIALVTFLLWKGEARQSVPDDRREVVFWHFWGGADREVVEDVVRRFNAAQDDYHVRAVAMPGNNLDLKVFLSVTGGDPPDLINQDDPIVADWAHRGALMPLEEVADGDEIDQLQAWLVPAAVRLGTYDQRLYALCNGLDIRALFFNQTLLTQRGLAEPRAWPEFIRAAEQLTERGDDGRIRRFGYLPDPRRLWAWSIVFGGQLYDGDRHRLTLDDDANVRALAWMMTFRNRYSARDVAAFRQGDQSLPGKTFPLLAGRYAMVMDGQWRVRDIAEYQRSQRDRNLPVTRFGVVPLPAPSGGRADAGWVNGNFFVIPAGARQARGAWEFMKFWVGFPDQLDAAARTCAAGGWIPVSPHVAQQAEFQAFLQEYPLFAEFTRLAASPHQIPTPVVPGAPRLYRDVNDLVAAAMYVPRGESARERLRRAQRTLAEYLSQFDRETP